MLVEVLGIRVSSSEDDIYIRRLQHKILKGNRYGNLGFWENECGMVWALTSLTFCEREEKKKH